MRAPFIPPRLSTTCSAVRIDRRSSRTCRRSALANTLRADVTAARAPIDEASLAVSTFLARREVTTGPALGILPPSPTGAPNRSSRPRRRPSNATPTPAPTPAATSATRLTRRKPRFSWAGCDEAAEAKDPLDQGRR